ncbi:MAG: formylglycine-generating enzyme family protein [Polyangiaceae bacterium]|nr:formylglycine-generating enzyme family protein [Polyangiaceae bacterium]
MKNRLRSPSKGTEKMWAKKWRWVVGLVVVGLVVPSAWAEREKGKKPKASAGAPDLGLKQPVGKLSRHPDFTEMMVRLEGGTFRMGSEEGAPDERPVHQVTLKPFWLDITEVTVAAYQACVAAGACSKPDEGTWCNWGKNDWKDHPINCVDWEQATQFCRWANKRLPTEEEWEYGARQGGREGDRRYPWGDAEPSNQLCWNGEGNDVGKGGRQGTCPVGSYLMGNTPTRLRDMAGNVWEWTSSAYCPYTDSGYDVGKCGTSRILRGGSWYNYDAAWVRGAVRSWFTPSYRFYNVGFRCARGAI